MKLGAVTLAFAVLAVSMPVAAQDQPATAEPAKPVLQLKPTLWQPKTIHRSQLRPHLKPAIPAAAGEAEADVYVPPSQVNAMPARTGAVAGPVQLAATHSNVPPEVSASANPMPAATIRDFAGRYLGAGVEVALSPSPTEPPRRMSQVEISGDASEFTVKWATMRIGANFKAETVKSSQQEITFRPSAMPGQFVAVAASGGETAPDATAEIKDRTMVVLVSTPLAKGGRSIQRYERTLTDSGMDVVFTRTDDGKLVRQVNLTLTRSGSSIWRSL
jgi:hypothetical protein